MTTTEGVRDFAAEIDGLVRRIQDAPADGELLQRLAEVAAQWLRADGLRLPAPEPSAPRVALGRWLGRAPAPGATVLHAGGEDPAVAAALGAGGARVASFLDHPARAMLAALTHGSDQVAFHVLAEFDSAPRASADLVVVETRGIDTAAPLPLAASRVRRGGLLAVIGMPVLFDEDAWADAGTFDVDAAGTVQPAQPGSSAAQLALWRRIESGAVRRGGGMPLLEPEEPLEPAADAALERFEQAVSALADARGAA